MGRHDRFREVESEGSRRQSTGPTDRNRIGAGRRGGESLRVALRHPAGFGQGQLRHGWHRMVSMCQLSQNQGISQMKWTPPPPKRPQGAIVEGIIQPLGREDGAHKQDVRDRTGFGKEPVAASCEQPAGESAVAQAIASQAGIRCCWYESLWCPYKRLLNSGELTWT